MKDTTIFGSGSFPFWVVSWWSLARISHARQVKLRRHLKRYEQQFPFQQTHWHGFADGS
jgi:hypothetical protein